MPDCTAPRATETATGEATRGLRLALEAKPMPIWNVDLLQNRVDGGQVSFLRNFACPVKVAPWSWNTVLARSTPIIVSVIRPPLLVVALNTTTLAPGGAAWGRRQSPHLLTSGYSRDMVVRDSLLDPATTMLCKPFTLGQLAERVRIVREAPAKASRPVAASPQRQPAA